MVSSPNTSTENHNGDGGKDHLIFSSFLRGPPPSGTSCFFTAALWKEGGNQLSRQLYRFVPWFHPSPLDGVSSSMMTSSPTPKQLFHSFPRFLLGKRSPQLLVEKISHLILTQFIKDKC